MPQQGKEGVQTPVFRAMKEKEESLPGGRRSRQRWCLGYARSFCDRYKDYRYCLPVNVIAFIYVGLQACDLAYHLTTMKYLIQHHLHCYFAFFMDQILAYLLLSASSSAATRVDDWGKDEFTITTSASISMSFLAFALSSLVYGYGL